MQLSLEKFKPGDFATYYSIVKDDEVMRYVSGKGLSEQEARLKFNSILLINAADDFLGYFKVYDHENKFIGECKLTRYKDESPSLEIGYLLKKEFWRRGYGTAICSELLSLAQRVAPGASIVGIIYPENRASRNLLEKFGFKSYFVGEEDNIPTEKLKR